MPSLRNPRHRLRLEIRRRRFPDLASRKLVALETLMRPDFRGNFRNHLSYRIWNKPHRHTSAGIPTIESQLDRIRGVFPWQKENPGFF